MHPRAAAAVVFLTSAAVLVLEILAGRLLAPYVGVTIETYTAIIGVCLAGIAAGSWLGGAAADRVDPARLLGPLVVAGGGLAILSVPVVRTLGDASVEEVGPATVALALAGFFLPALVLSAVSPTVVKLQLHDLERTGVVVGRLSGIGTAGALVGTFLTGFVLVAALPTTTVVYALGGLLLVLGGALWLWLWRRDASELVALLVLAGLATGWAAVADVPCQVESAYSCIRVTHESASGRLLWINRDRHAYVDLADPTHLEFEYTQGFADVVDVGWPDRRPLGALHVGGGGFTVPRWLAATRPGSRSVVLEVDPAVVEVAEDRLGLRRSEQLRVEVGDARIGIRGVADGSVDLVVGDAFADLSVPWHLTTREFVAAVDRVLAPGGIYVLNVIDEGPLRFLRAEVATLAERFEVVAAISEPTTFDEGLLANTVLVASHRPLDLDAVAALATSRGEVVLRGDALARFAGGAPVLTDDHAPVDQWLREGRA